MKIARLVLRIVALSLAAAAAVCAIEIGRASCRERV